MSTDESCSWLFFIYLQVFIRKHMPKDFAFGKFHFVQFVLLHSYLQLTLT